MVQSACWDLFVSLLARGSCNDKIAPQMFSESGNLGLKLHFWLKSYFSTRETTLYPAAGLFNLEKFLLFKQRVSLKFNILYYGFTK